MEVIARSVISPKSRDSFELGFNFPVLEGNIVTHVIRGILQYHNYIIHYTTIPPRNFRVRSTYLQVVESQHEVENVCKLLGECLE